MKEKFEKHKLLILETIPPRSVTVKKYIRFCEMAINRGVDVIAITDLPMGKVKISPIAPAHVLCENNIDILMHFTRTTRNIIRIEGDLLAAHMLGVNNILILSGDDPSFGTYPFATRVDDLSIYELFKLVKLLNEGKDLAGNRICGNANFYFGGVFSLYEKAAEVTIERMNKKIKNGSSFFVSQPIMEPEIFLRFWDIARKTLLPTKLVLSLIVLESVERMMYFSTVPGIFIPSFYKNINDDNILYELSLEAIFNTIKLTYEIVSGYYITATTKNLDTIEKIARYIKNFCS
ncbi:methylenetetrahydrofolate reductase [Thermosipho ferrireducens]|uniref:Methylenetetrahydrofolate reductase n=1 Tax=Thermosipho ferrireducens TaxID=2571116 RepID=A0ABX7S9Y9_9BACT|nr:methylenetetrahydrofolate reductase [Thermosipho ferrireducens]QTA38751.1 methylenetetrahydrofolate reductase [Thermosipho ferrireducens]